MSNVAIVVEEEPPRGMPLLGLYQGVPLTGRSSAYGGVLPDKITIYRRPLERLYGGDAERQRLRALVEGCVEWAPMGTGDAQRIGADEERAVA